ncbi:MAG: Hypothetical protein BHV28_01400 [Candidatus Tokpelaia hoelldobleri]|uniref:Prokaryotic-type class I peptide chain release factors domain-containing protein n=1 Tax=Candidatus Tokpelaia hoelldobleri TaxID=1902579 RepID=A0A1U9JSN0_9HYPH|nr:MAG: Hypothetical protein BHV28_01400 [Candidatus Tokpelaia hoelldoblerii]
MIVINNQLTIHDEDYEEHFIRSSGPGGQNVNKVATAVQLRLFTGRLNLPEDVTRRLIKLAGRRANHEGEILIEANRFRTQERNREDAKQRLADLLRQAFIPPPPPRKKTKPSRRAVERRLQQKNTHGMLKKLRGKISRGDD